MRLTEYGCLDLTDGLDLTGSSDQSIVYGGFVDIITAKLHRDGARVAIKYPASGELDVSMNRVILTVSY